MAIECIMNENSTDRKPSHTEVTILFYFVLCTYIHITASPLASVIDKYIRTYL